MVGLSTPHIADACVRLGLPVRIASVGLRPAIAALASCSGHVMPVFHTGSVDVFLRAAGLATPGDILVIDNQGRFDEGCIGDLSVMELKMAGFDGVLVWGAHRDTSELAAIGLPVFSYGQWSQGPNRASVEGSTVGEPIRFGDFEVIKGDRVLADADGAIFVTAKDWPDVERIATEIASREGAQAAKMRQGVSLRDQLGFADYLAKNKADSAYTFRQHLRLNQGAIEE